VKRLRIDAVVLLDISACLMTVGILNDHSKVQNDPNLTVALLQTSQSAKSSAWELEIYKAVIGDRIQRPILRHPHIEGACQYRALAISANTEKSINTFHSVLLTAIFCGTSDY